MKNIKTTLLAFLLININLQAQNERYLDEIFPEVTVETGLEYAINWDIMTNVPELDTLVFDLYTPTGDTKMDRPAVILWTGGSFLPNPLNGSTLGTQTDYANVEIACRLAKRGYVALIPTYRKGWNPIATDIHTRASGFLNAIYRGVQDSRAMVRFLRKSIEEEENIYGICGDKIVQWGLGSGGFIAANSTTLDSYSDLLLEKFEFDNTEMPEYYIDLDINSDPSGSTETILNRVNHAGYDDEAALCVNMGGALADSSFLDISDPPMICFSTTLDNDVPYGTQFLFTPGLDLIFEVSGSFDIITRAQELGINDIFASVSGDPFSEAAAYTAANPNYAQAPASGPEGLNGLMPFNRPLWENPFNSIDIPENAPWDYWDAEYWSTIAHPNCLGFPLEDCNFHIINSLDNQDMSLEKANVYLDSVMGYVLPRAFLALNLSNENCLSGIEDLLEQQSFIFDIFPNPVTSALNIKTDLTILKANLYNLQGNQVASFDNVNAKELEIKRKEIPIGVYLIKIKTEKGIATRKVVFN